MEPTVVLLLSDKRSGSTMFEREICRHPDVRHVEYTPHTYSETQHWLKGARLVGMPPQTFYGHRYYGGLQSSAATRALMIDELRGNLPEFEIPSDDEELVFQGWEALCEKFAKPVFFEKSPHHLGQWACLSTLLQWMERTKFRTKIIGLVRNPLAVQYSAFELFQTIPEERQYGWAEMYRYLLAFRQMIPPDDFHLIRYEDLTEQPQETFAAVYDFLGIAPQEFEDREVHRRSLRRWVEDPDFGLQLHESVKQVARIYGYLDEDLHNPAKPPPPLSRQLVKTARRWTTRALGIPRRSILEPLRSWWRTRSG